MMTFTDPKEWWLELSPVVEADVLHQSQQCNTFHSRHTAFLNGLCLRTVLEWLREDAPEIHPSFALAEFFSIWDVVNGAAVNVGSTRLVLIPSESIDNSELAVPQEWVDIPSWVGDYYLAVQVQVEQRWVRIWGYTTHEALKINARFDSSDRTYCLDSEQLTQDLNAFWVTYQLCGNPLVQAAVSPLPELPPAQAESLIQRLGNPAVMFPRLAIPFSLWGALLSQADWRRQLFQQRAGIESNPRSVTRLGEWLHGSFAATWQAIETVLSPQQSAIAWRNESTSESALFTVSRAKVLEFGTPAEVASVALVVRLAPTGESRVLVEIQVCPTGEQIVLPSPVQVKLLDASGGKIGQATATVTEMIQMQFEADAGEQFQVEVRSGTTCITENFEI